MGFITYLLITLFGYQQINGLRLTNIVVPEIADVRDTVTLSCSYNMGNHILNSVKWYKDTNEFFRYAPMMYPTIMSFPVVGVTLSTDRNYFCNKETCSVSLMQLDTKSTGSYRCEVSGDSPEFKLIDQTANMTIAALPKHDPIISGVSKIYTIGDFVIANCTSDMSSPSSTLYWYINNEMAPTELLQIQQETTIEADGFILRSRSLEIRFFLDKIRFGNSKGIIKLKCLAIIESIPLATRESTATIHIRANDDLRNQKLINWRNSVSGIHHSSTNINYLIILIYVLIKMILMQNIYYHVIT